MKNIRRFLGIIALLFGFVLAFIIQDANVTFSIAAQNLTASAADFSAYLYSFILCFGGFGLLLK